MKRLGLLTTAIMAVIFSYMPSVSAATFDFDGGSGTTASAFFSMDGIGLTVTAGRFDFAIPITFEPGVDRASRVRRSNSGLGVDRGRFDPGDVDGLHNDILIFNFDQKVRFESILFKRTDFTDDFRFLQDTGTNGDAVVDGIMTDFGSQVDIPSSDLFVFSQVWDGKLFGVGALFINDNFRISELTVTAVPIPAALPLFAGGLGLLGLMGWRRKRATA